MCWKPKGNFVIYVTLIILSHQHETFHHYPTDTYTTLEILSNCHPRDTNLHAHANFETSEYLAQSKANVLDFSQGTTQHQLAMFKLQIVEFETTLGTSTHTPSSSLPTTLLMYSENPVTSFSNFFSTYMFDSLAQTTEEKLND